ncbi:unnamed protein product [Lactuca virosa]|nr:unnamed protein product [Lactuca virosa]
MVKGIAALLPQALNDFLGILVSRGNQIISIAFLIPQINQSYYVIIDRSFVVRRLLHQPVDFSRSASSLPRSSLNQR